MSGGGASSGVDCRLAVVGNVGRGVGFSGPLPGLAVVGVGCGGWQYSWGVEYGRWVARGVAGCGWCPRVRSLGQPPAVAAVGWVGGGGRQLWLPGLEPGIVMSVVVSCRALVGVWAAEMGVALGGWRLGSGCGYRGLARWVGPIPGVWCGCPCWVVGHAGGGGFPGRGAAVGVWAWRLVVLVMWCGRLLRLARCRRWQGVSLWLARDPALAQ